MRENMPILSFASEHGSLPYITDYSRGETFQENEHSKLSPNATVNGRLRVWKAANITEASHNWIVLVQINKFPKFLSEKGIGAPLTMPSRGLCAKIILPPPRPLDISMVGIIENISKHATFWGINRSTLQPTPSTIQPSRHSSFKLEAQKQLKQNDSRTKIRILQGRA